LALYPGVKFIGDTGGIEILPQGNPELGMVKTARRMAAGFIVIWMIGGSGELSLG
jgi:hypothetical protein